MESTHFHHFWSELSCTAQQLRPYGKAAQLTAGAARYHIFWTSLHTLVRLPGSAPVASARVGEGALELLRHLPDNTSEARNRRVEYILSVEDPVLPASDFQPSWKTLLSK